VTFVDSNLTHANLTTIRAVAAYNVGIGHLLQNDGDSEGAILAMKSYVESTSDVNL